MKKVAVVILNWNGKKFLEEFLPSVIKYSSNDAEVIIADNASTDDSVAFLQNQYPELRIVRNDNNYGFAEGYNCALRQVQADYYVLLNSDIEVAANWIPPVIELMESSPEIAICQPKLLSFYHRDTFEYAGAAGGFIDRYGYPFCKGRLFASLEKDEGQYDSVCEIFWASGAAMFVKSDIYWKFGGLDGDFFAHMEEIDFCWRVKNGGYKVMFCPDSKVYHVGGGTLPKSSARKTYLNFRNNFTLLYKNLPRRKLFPVFATRLFLDGFAAIKFLTEGASKDFLAVTKAHFYFYTHFKNIAKKRKQFQQKEASQLYTGCIVFDHYLRGVKKFSQLRKEKFNP